MSGKIKYADDVVINVRNDYFINNKSMGELAKEYGVPKRTVHMWVTREKRQNVGGASGIVRRMGYDERKLLTQSSS